MYVLITIAIQIKIDTILISFININVFMIH